MVMTTRSYHFHIHDSPAIFIIGINKELVDFTVIKIFKLKKYDHFKTSRAFYLNAACFGQSVVTQCFRINYRLYTQNQFDELEWTVGG
jgi:hypothetical protein